MDSYLLRAARMDRTPQTGSRVSPTKKVTSAAFGHKRVRNITVITLLLEFFSKSEREEKHSV